MPGIVGLVTDRPRAWAEPQVRRMLEPLRHKCSYEVGTWSDEALGVYLAWTAHAGSFSAGMPVSNESGDVVLVFSGEEFPDPSIRQTLSGHGHCVAPDGPDYLVHAYEEDEAFPAGLNGRFHGVVADRARGRAMLFNDRYGLHRVYYHEAKDALYFATEAKAILGVRPELRRLNTQSLGEYIACGCTLENRSLFDGIEVLPPASAWICRGGVVERKAVYFTPGEWEAQEPLSPDAYYGALRDVFSRNLQRYVTASAPVGLSLTGGLDTRMIVAWWKAPPNSVPCYTFRGMFNDCQDAFIGRRVAALWRQPFQEILVGREFLSRFAEYAERTVYLTDGCASVGRAPVLCANEHAGQIAPIRLTGNYGSEILRRMVAFKPVNPAAGLFTGDIMPAVRNARETYAKAIDAHPVSFIAFRQMPWHHWGLLALEQSELSPRSPYLDNDLVRMAFRAPASSLIKGHVLADNRDCLHLIQDGNQAFRRLRTDRGIGGDGTFGAALARVALEVTFKAEYEYDYGMPQWLARFDHSLSWLHLERAFLGRHKYYHFRVWYRDELGSYVKEMLLDPRTLGRPFLDKGRVDEIVSSHVAGTKNYTSEIHQLLTLELICRSFLDA